MGFSPPKWGLEWENPIIKKKKKKKKKKKGHIRLGTWPNQRRPLPFPIVSISLLVHSLVFSALSSGGAHCPLFHPSSSHRPSLPHFGSRSLSRALSLSLGPSRSLYLSSRTAVLLSSISEYVTETHAGGDCSEHLA